MSAAEASLPKTDKSLRVPKLILSVRRRLPRMMLIRRRRMPKRKLGNKKTNPDKRRTSSKDRQTRKQNRQMLRRLLQLRPRDKPMISQTRRRSSSRIKPRR